MVKIEEVVGTLFAIFVGLALFMSFEPTRTIIEQIVGALITGFFVGVVILVVVGIIYLVMKLSEKNII